MSAFVVDTNVAVAANRRDTHADERCQLACIDRLEHVARQGVVAVDRSGLIIGEYAGRLSRSGQPGTGDAFFKHILNHQWQDSRVRRVPVTASDDDRKGFEELPENSFDRSDRVFLAVAVASDAIVLNATDSDWDEHAGLMDDLGVEVAVNSSVRSTSAGSREGYGACDGPSDDGRGGPWGSANVDRRWRVAAVQSRRTRDMTFGYSPDSEAHGGFRSTRGERLHAARLRRQVSEDALLAVVTGRRPW